jgi:putative hydrolase of the HAD superfamily
VAAMALRGLIMDYAGVLTDGAEMRDLPRRARAAGRPTALVSSAGSVSREIEALFDVLVLGGTVGAVKPDPEVYRRTAALLGLTAAECVVVDDLQANIRGAREAGAVGVLHDDPDTTIGEVEILLALPDLLLIRRVVAGSITVSRRRAGCRRQAAPSRRARRAPAGPAGRAVRPAGRRCRRGGR